MRILDSNLLIYSAQDRFIFLRVLLEAEHTYISAVSKVETLGYHKLNDDERSYFDDIFKVASVIPVTNEIIDKAVEIRQQKKMSLGDCLIAATALLNNLELYTNNTADFTNIPGLAVRNPLNLV